MPNVGNLVAPWKPGQTGNPNGRPIGSRSAFSQSHVRDFQTVWDESGIKAIREMASKNPSGFVGAALTPRRRRNSHYSMLMRIPACQSLIGECFGATVHATAFLRHTIPEEARAVSDAENSSNKSGAGMGFPSK